MHTHAHTRTHTHTHQCRHPPLPPPPAQFKLFDPNRTGFIATAEIQQILGTVHADISPNELDEVVKELDLDGDGRISYKEFAALMLE